MKRKTLINMQFLNIVKKLILPLFPGSKLRKDPKKKSSTARKLCAIQPGSTSIALRQNKDDDPIVIDRAQTFISKDSEVVSNFIIQWNKFALDKRIPHFYRTIIAEKCLEYAILQSVCQSHPKILTHLLTIINYWQNRTYEGNKVSFSLKISRESLKKRSNESLFDKDNLYCEDFFASISNGINDCVVFDEKLNIIEHKDLPVSTADGLFTPNRMANLCEASDNAVVLALTRANEILIFADKTLAFVKRNGKWTLYRHDTTVTQLAGGTTNTISKVVRTSMYLSALDVSFTKTGGLIACIDKKNIKDAQTLFSDDIICNGCKKQRIGVFKELIAGKKFQDLSRSLRAELIAIDGATIIDSDGNVLAVGAIVKLEGGSSSGGRKAATKALSEYGTAIKISNDSYIEGFRKGAELFKI